ncbi:MAG: hypothetical protein K2X27_21605 [Candidatus Obscuribacterales bacterium]|nr:hypothetical protein [Candidatus Obscuribacterales bacterium]
MAEQFDYAEDDCDFSNGQNLMPADGENRPFVDLKEMQSFVRPGVVAENPATLSGKGVADQLISNFQNGTLANDLKDILGNFQISESVQNAGAAIADLVSKTISGGDGTPKTDRGAEKSKVSELIENLRRDYEVPEAITPHQKMMRHYRDQAVKEIKAGELGDETKAALEMGVPGVEVMIERINERLSAEGVPKRLIAEKTGSGVSKDGQKYDEYKVKVESNSPDKPNVKVPEIKVRQNRGKDTP